MASSSSSASSATSGSSVSVAQATKTPSLFSSSSQTASIKLDIDNFLVWESVVRPFIKGNRLMHHISSLAPPPPETLSDGAEKVTSELLAFESRIDQLNNQFSSLSVQPSANVAQRDDSKTSGAGQNQTPWRGGSPQGFLNRSGSSGSSSAVNHDCIIPLVLGEKQSGLKRDSEIQGINGEDNVITATS
ncbi:uncharacterized protein G2W53_020318 [Senna tora]|uniref:Retrotransposon Copia-like N-terminal domain-containing protein n=1 Tax=Senna tora TaxID=362788 RepID=A0A834U331_9FABA|nr:uncharacterized protein G2W53_020318 [Senna tora]